MATPAAHPPGAPDGGEISHARGRVEDRELARRAVAGDGDAFAELYDRHERRVYGFCMRMLGAPHDAADATQETFVRMLGRLPAMQGRELNFVAYALACARNACYDMIEGRRRVEPTGEQPDGASLGAGVDVGPAAPGDVALDPERAALLAATREGVRAANAELPARQREVLALREVELLSYDEIGEIMGLNRNAVAQLVSRARIKLRDLVRGSELASIATASPDCARAQPLLASMQDDQPGERGELDWARAHLGACETCRLSRAAMEEAGVSYRALAPLVPAAWLRHAAIARAAEFVGADWSRLVGSGMRTGGGPVTDTGPASHGGEYSAMTSASGLAARSATGSLRRPRRLAWLLAAAAVLALGIVVVAMAGGTRDGPGRSLSSQSAPAGVQTSGPAATGGATRGRRLLPAAGSYGAAGPSTGGVAVHASTGASPAIASPGSSTRRAGKRHRRRSASGRRSPPVSSTPAVTVPPPPPAPSPTTTTSATSAPAPTPTTTVPPAQTTPEPAPPTTTPGGSTGTTTTPTAPPETPRGGGLIP